MGLAPYTRVKASDLRILSEHCLTYCNFHPDIVSVAQLMFSLANYHRLKVDGVWPSLPNDVLTQLHPRDADVCPPTFFGGEYAPVFVNFVCWDDWQNIILRTYNDAADPSTPMRPPPPVFEFDGPLMWCGEDLDSDFVFDDTVDVVLATPPSSPCLPSAHEYPSVNKMDIGAGTPAGGTLTFPAAWQDDNGEDIGDTDSWSADWVNEKRHEPYILRELFELLDGP
jgi:hypothetical protein